MCIQHMLLIPNVKGLVSMTSLIVNSYGNVKVNSFPAIHVGTEKSLWSSAVEASCNLNEKSDGNNLKQSPVLQPTSGLESHGGVGSDCLISAYIF